jgi:sugar lactone lactonase YvrE
VTRGGVEVVAEPACLLGEGPVWLPGSGELLFVDILPGRVHRLRPETGALESVELRTAVGAAVPRAGGGFAVATREGFGLLDWERGTLEPLAAVEAERPENRMNDGKCDAAGRFWAGTMSERREPAAGSLYRLDADGSVSRVLNGVTISNGLAWSGDGATMYYIDSLAHRVDAFDFDPAAGAVSGRRRLVELPEELGVPDGMTADAEGNLWIAFFGGSAVRCYSPAGEAVEVLELPVSLVTSVAFGGPDLRDLYITSATYRLSEPERHGGAVFRCRPGVAGVAADAFAG